MKLWNKLFKPKPPKTWTVDELIEESLRWANENGHGEEFRDALRRTRTLVNQKLDDCDDWIIEYNPDLFTVERNHPRGGKQTVCEVFDHKWGHAIAEALNRKE